MNMKKSAAIFWGLIFTFANMFAFEWPVENAAQNNFVNRFGQKRGQEINTSLVFRAKTFSEDEEPVEDVKSIDRGRLTVIITSLSDDNDFFPSALGNAVIINHDDGIISVYANLEEDEALDQTAQKSEIENQIKIGSTGNSSWHRKDAGLELKIIDTKNRNAINPRILLPRFEKENVFAPTEIKLVDKNGKIFDLNQNKNIPRGMYKIYQKYNETAIPYKITAMLNGEESDTITFDTFNAEENSLWINGSRKKFQGALLYPDDKSLLSGEITLTPGKTVMNIINTNILGDSKTLTINLTVH